MKEQKKRSKYLILGEILDFGNPQQRRELPDRFPRSKLVFSHQIVDVKDGGLDDCFELSTNERSSILHDVVGTDGVD
jgi:hypothetical protein